MAEREITGGEVDVAPESGDTVLLEAKATETEVVPSNMSSSGLSEVSSGVLDFSGEGHQRRHNGDSEESSEVVGKQEGEQKGDQALAMVHEELDDEGEKKRDQALVYLYI